MTATTFPAITVTHFKYVLLFIVLLLGACTSTPPVTTLLEGNVVMIQGGYLTVPTAEGPRSLRDGGCMRIRLLGDKDHYLPGEFYLSEDCYRTGPEDINLITSHYRGGIRLDRAKQMVIVDIQFANGAPYNWNGRYRYVDKR